MGFCPPRPRSAPPDRCLRTEAQTLAVAGRPRWKLRRRSRGDQQTGRCDGARSRRVSASRYRPIRSQRNSWSTVGRSGSSTVSDCTKLIYPLNSAGRAELSPCSLPGRRERNACAVAGAPSFRARPSRAFCPREEIRAHPRDRVASLRGRPKRRCADCRPMSQRQQNSLARLCRVLLVRARGAPGFTRIEGFDCLEPGSVVC